VSADLGSRIAQQFVEVLFAPGYDNGALAALRAKPTTRVLLDAERRRLSPGERDYRRVLGGLIVQDRDSSADERQSMRLVCGGLDESRWGDVLFAWRVCKHVTSNAIVVARNLQTLGIGAGQMSRVDAVRIALQKARDLGHSLEGATVASDAFFPFADGPRLTLDAGVRVIVQPGGSKRDEEVVAAVESSGAAMVFTDRRHFRH
jgi:phosphoribosylaminoimidazolecarboxamide formyltransferase/IMP cyclohydrolase